MKMDAERWQRVEELFHRLEPLPLPERRTLLEAECGDDLELIAQVEGMLAEAQTSSWIDQSLRAALKPLAEEETLPQRIGPYRILREIGRGGLATVLLGERDDQYRMRVAIKLIKRGMDSGEILRRLRQERQILAHLNHPHIARLLDGGTSEDGRPYFVMEHIEGEPIDQYCFRRNLPLAERLELFLKVCDALRYAHSNLIIHRDIKPANILVTTEATPKLLDFGIAKLLQHDFHDATIAHTVTGMLLLTPEYASPEQVRGETLTTAADVYSLGVLLFQLLTGCRPYAFPNRTARTFERIICEVDPPKPSIALRAEDADPAPNGGSRQLAGDLDTITLKALRKEPEHRYTSVEQLADDLRRFLSDRPVLARQDLLGYRIGKFVRRHRTAVATAVFVISTLIAATILTTWQRGVAVNERKRAEDQWARAETVSEFLVELFEVSDPGESLGNTITARELLDNGAKHIGRLEEQPESQAMLKITMGRTYKNLGIYDQAAALFEEAVAQYRSLADDHNGDLATGINHLGEARFSQGRYLEARELFQESFNQRRVLWGEEHADIAESLNNLAAVHHALGELDPAEMLYRQALEIKQRLLGPNHLDLARGLVNLAVLLQLQDKVQESEELLLQALAMRIALVGEHHPQVAQNLNELGTLKHKIGDFDSAEVYYRQALELRLEILGEEHSDLAISYSNLAALFRDKNDYATAESLLRRSLELNQRLLRKGHPVISYNLNILADLLRVSGTAADLQEAEELYRKALAIRRENFSPGHHSIANSLMGLGQTFLKRNDPQSAEGFLAEALEIRSKVFSEDHRLTIETRDLLNTCRQMPQTSQEVF